ncbi:MAG: site-specific DNA-methyltransferase [bacterium]|nr:site-specific DNA-methyltransferase [bacterium]
MNIDKYLNKVFNKDIFKLLDELPDNSIDCIFGDPDYNVGIKYAGGTSFTRGFDKYIEWYIELTKKAFRVLKETGNMFLINYPRQNAYLWAKYLDEVSYDVQEYVWVYNTNVGHSKRRFTTAHRTILHCTKSKNNKFYKNNVAMPYLNPTDKRIIFNIENGSKGRMPYSWYFHNLVKNVSKEKTYHVCQIPQKLSKLLIESCTMPKDTVLILFGGSGAELEVCQKNNRHFISAELNKEYYNMISERLKTGKIPEIYKLEIAKKKLEGKKQLFPSFQFQSITR